MFYSIKCKRRVNSLTGYCENTACDDHNSEPQLSYDTRIDLSDHSGSLASCRLLSSALETMFGYSVGSLARIKKTYFEAFYAVMFEKSLT